jgi:Ran GTPase-activating protein (RanGAP) involved in mRNA processing and transport
MFQIGARGAQSLAIALETNKVLEHLALNNCDLGDEGVEPIANGRWSQWGKTMSC